MEPKTKFVNCLSPTGSHKMAYYEWGSADNNNVLICVHGLSRSGRDFDALARVLSSDYRIICPDVVGRGQSDWLTDPLYYSIPQYVSDMLTLVQQVQATKLSWFGTSMGGLIGICMAAMPQNAISALLINDIGPKIELAGLQRIGSYVGRPDSWAQLDDAIAYIQQVSASFGEHTPALWREFALSVLKQRPDGQWVLHYDPQISQGFKSSSIDVLQAGEQALWLAYDAIHCPTLVVRGEQSDILSESTVVQMQQRGPCAKSITIPRVGHAPTFMQAEQIQIAVSFFLGV